MAKIHIDEIEMFFNTFGYPEHEVQIDPAVTITEGKTFVENSIRVLRNVANKPDYVKRTLMPTYNDLVKYFEIVKKESLNEEK